MTWAIEDTHLLASCSLANSARSAAEGGFVGVEGSPRLLLLCTKLSLLLLLLLLFVLLLLLSLTLRLLPAARARKINKSVVVRLSFMTSLPLPFVLANRAIFFKSLFDKDNNY
jgi:hypothetical protein